MHNPENVTEKVKGWITEDSGMGFGAVLPILRIATSGTMKGPDVFAMMSLLGKEEVVSRLQKAYDAFDAIKNAAAA